MGPFVKGDVVVIPFPFTDLSKNKRRPALVISVLQGNDLILCQITTANRPDNYSISLLNEHFQEGKLRQDSYIRVHRLFTAESNIIVSKIGKLRQEKLEEVLKKLVELIESN